MSNPRVIVERIRQPSYAFLEMLFQSGVELSPEDIDGSYPACKDTVISECVARGTLDFFKWVCTLFSKHLLLEFYEEACSRCLVDHVLIARDIASNFGTYRLDLASYSVPAYPTALTKDVIRYTEWMINVGHARFIEPEVMESIIDRLISAAQVNLVRSLLHVVMTIEDQFHHVRILLTFYEDCPILRDLMFEVGLMYTRSARTILLICEFGEDPSTVIYDDHPAKISPLRLVIEMLSDEQGTFFHKTQCYPALLRKIKSLDAMSEYSISRFAVPILSFLLGATKKLINNNTSTTQERQSMALDLLTGQILKPDSFGGVEDLNKLEDVTRLVLRFGEIFVMKGHRDMIMSQSSEEVIKVYQKTSNELLHDLLVHPDSNTRNHGVDKAAEIIKLLGPAAQIHLVEKLTGFHINDDYVFVVVLNEIRESRLPLSPNDESLLVLADNCLAHLTSQTRLAPSILDVINTNFALIGDKTLNNLLRIVVSKSISGMSAYLVDKIFDFAERNPKIYLLHLLGAYSGQQSIRLHTKITASIYLTGYYLVLGNRLYRRSSGVFTDAEMPRLLPNCSGCGEKNIEDMFIDSIDNHWKYYCSKCIIQRSEETISRPNCGVCLANDDELQMNVLSWCGHSFCSGCLIRLRDPTSVVTCPLCRLMTPIVVKAVSVERIIDTFMEEWTISPEATRINAKRHVKMITDQSSDAVEAEVEVEDEVPV